MENIDSRCHKDRHDAKETKRRLTPQNMFQGQTKSITDVKQTAIKLDKTTLDAIQHQIQVAVCVFFTYPTVFFRSFFLTVGKLRILARPIVPDSEETDAKGKTKAIEIQ